MALLDRLQITFQIFDGSLLKAASYNWTSVLNAKSNLYLTIGSLSAGTLSGITQSGDEITIKWVSGSVESEVVIVEDKFGTGTHLIDFSNIQTVGYYELGMWDGFEFRKFTAFRAIDPAK